MSSIINSMKEVYLNRNLVYSMVMRNLKGRYKNSFFGFLWHFITPIISILLFYIVFTSIGLYSIEYYWAYLCIGMFPFTFFRDNLGPGSGSIVSNGNMIKKIYFPREIVVISQVLSTFITLLFAYVGVVILMVVSGMSIQLSAIVYLPLIMLLSVVFTAGYVFLFSAINVFIRDVRYFIEAFSRVLFWITPVFYMSGETTGILEKIIWFNPFTYFVEFYHDVLYYNNTPDVSLLLACLIISILTFVIGMVVFNKLKGKFAEEL